LIDVWLVAWLVVGVALVWTAERRRRGRLLRRVAIELEGVEAVVERRRALLARLAQELPQVVPVCHGALDQLGRAQRASADAAEAWRGRPGDPGAAGELRAAEVGWSEAMEEVAGEAAAVPSYARLVEFGVRVRARCRAAEDALEHVRLR